jgi:hypothetical protein
VHNIFLASLALSLLGIPLAQASDHHILNGTWILVPTSGSGSEVIRTAQITINNRQHNIYISRNFTYDEASETVTVNFATDGREQAAIRLGQTSRSKAKWDGDVLTVRTVGDQGNEKEQYSLRPDGLMMLVVEHAGRPPFTLYFQRE